MTGVIGFCHDMTRRSVMIAAVDTEEADAVRRADSPTHAEDSTEGMVASADAAATKATRDTATEHDIPRRGVDRMQSFSVWS